MCAKFNASMVRVKAIAVESGIEKAVLNMKRALISLVPLEMQGVEGLVTADTGGVPVETEAKETHGVIITCDLFI